MTNQPSEPAASSESANPSSSPPPTPPDPAAAQDAASSSSTSSSSSEDSSLGSRVREQLATRSEDAAKRAPAPAKPMPRKDDEEDPSESPSALPPRSKGPRIPVPSKRAPLSADLEQELEEALGSAPLDQLIEKQSAAAEPTEQLDLETRRRAPVVRIHKDNVFFALGGRNEGVASLRQFKQPPNIGDQLEVAITGYNAEDSLYELSIAGASIQVGDWSDINVGSLVEARVLAARCELLTHSRTQTAVFRRGRGG